MGARTEEIRGAIANMGEEALADALALLLGEGTAQAGLEAAGAPEFENFAQAIQYLKRRHGFPELALFSTEADLVYVMTDGRRVLLTDRDAPGRVEPRRQMATEIRSSGIDDASEAPSAPIPSSDKTAVMPEDKGGTGRFSHLEL